MSDIFDNENLYLSLDKNYLLNEKDEIIAKAQQQGDKTIYLPESDLQTSGGRVCIRTETKAKKICVEYGANKICIGWGYVDIQVCVEWKTT